MIINHLLLWHFLPVISTAAKTSISVSSSSHLLQVTFTHTTTKKLGPCHNGSKLLLHFQVFQMHQRTNGFQKTTRQRTSNCIAGRLFLWFLDFWGTLVIIRICSQTDFENCNYKSKVALRFWELWLCIRTWLFDFFRAAFENNLQNLQLSASNFDNCPILVQ